MIDLIESQYWPHQKLRDLQTERMRVVIKFAYDNIKGYRELWDRHGVNSSEIREIEDLKLLPTVSRSDMQDYRPWVCADNIVTTMHTGGSTGEPMTYYEDNVTKMMRAAKHDRGWIWSGFKQKTDRRAVVCSQRGGVGRGKLTLNIPGNPDVANIGDMLDRIRDFKPKQIRAYVSTAYIMASWIKNNNYEIIIPSINLIAEQLYPEQREIISRAFNGCVYEEYVCCDGGASAWDCEKREGLHEVMERAIIESDDDDFMIVTDLWNRAMPFIRYRNGDKLFRQNNKCSCGRALPIIKVQGRDNDIIEAETGPVSPSYILHHISHLETDGKHIKYKAFQIVQSGKDLDLNIIVDDGYCMRQEEHLTSLMRELCPGLDIKINHVTELEKTKSGKMKFIIRK